MPIECPFCKEYRCLKRDFDKDTAEDSRYTTKFKVTLRTEFYFNGEPSESAYFGTFELNCCPVCGKKIKGE